MASDPTNTTSPLGKVTAAAPAYTADQMAPFSLDEDGNLRVITDAGMQAMVTAIGTPSDAVWSGTGDGTVISILKKIANEVTP